MSMWIYFSDIASNKITIFIYKYAMSIFCVGSEVVSDGVCLSKTGHCLLYLLETTRNILYELLSKPLSCRDGLSSNSMGIALPDVRMMPDTVALFDCVSGQSR